MKLKHVFTTLGLASIMALGIGASTIGLNDIKQAKADGANTWMFRVYLNERNNGEDLGLSNIRFHCWGNNVDITQQMSYLGDNVVSNSWHAANVSFKDDQTVTGCQFIVTKNGSDYYSTDIEIAIDKNTTHVEFGWDIKTSTLSDAKWSVTNDGVNTKDFLSLYYDGIGTMNFVADPANNVYKINNVTIADNGTSIDDRYLTFNPGCLDHDFLYTMLDEDSRIDYIKYGSAQWASFKSYGVYDFVLCGDNGFSGLKIHKHETSSSSYIYYVTGEAEATQNYAYTFKDGDDYQAFGTWPGLPVLNIAGEEEVTKGVVHFQGNNVRIYKIPVNLGADNNDQIIFSYQEGGVTKAQSANLYMKPGTALWWSAQYNYTNDKAGKALDFIYELETIRNAVTAHDDIKSTSICGISKSDAISLVNKYNALSSEIKEVYIDTSKVLTYKADKTEGNEMVSYHDIMIRLSIIAEVGLTSNLSAPLLNNNSIIIFIIVATSIIIISFAGVMILRRRKHQ